MGMVCRAHGARQRSRGRRVNPRDESRACVAVFTRDLRVHDNPMLLAAVASGQPVVPLFVYDSAILGGRARRHARDRYLEEALDTLDRSLRRRGAGLVRRHGRWATEVLRVAAESGAGSIHVLQDVTPYARRRLDRLRERAGSGLAITAHEGLTVLPPGVVMPSGSDHYRVFTPYHRRWLATPWRPLDPAPRRIRALPCVFDPAELAGIVDGRPGRTSTTAAVGMGNGRIAKRSNRSGGEDAARRRLATWLSRGVDTYAQTRERLDRTSGNGTSRLSTDLHFGCLSALEVASRARLHDGAAPFVRQLCWRDFYVQAVSARPKVVWENFVDRQWSWRSTPTAFEMWKQGRTGYPLVDAAMRQLAAEGFVPNRARMVAASFLAKDLELDWRSGASHFLELLVDADIVVNNLNWQWMAGTGTGSHPNRALSPERQGRRFDPDGAYVRRYVPELAGVPASRIHRPTSEDRQTCGYPMPIVDHG